MARTAAGEVLEMIGASYTMHPRVPGTFIEGERDTASMWVYDEATGKHFQVHVTELEPTDKELAYYRALSRLA